MTPTEKISAAIDLLHELDADPRHPALRDLESLLADPPQDDSALILTATIQQGGVYSVTDQHGRKIHGVQSVAVFKDQQGRDVMQVNL